MNRRLASPPAARTLLGEMRTARRVALAAACAVALATLPAAAGLHTGDAAPVANVELADAHGRAVRLAPLGDSGLLVVFHASSCAEAAAAEAELVDLADRATVGLVRTFVIDPAATSAELHALAGDGPARFEHLADPRHVAVEAFGATFAPEAFLFDGHGRLVYHGAVGDSADDDALAAALDSLLARQPIAVAENAPTGCPIASAE